MVLPMKVETEKSGTQMYMGSSACHLRAIYVVVVPVQHPPLCMVGVRHWHEGHRLEVVTAKICAPLTSAKQRGIRWQTKDAAKA